MGMLEDKQTLSHTEKGFEKCAHFSEIERKMSKERWALGCHPGTNITGGP